MMKDEVEGWLQGKTGIRRHKKESNEKYEKGEDPRIDIQSLK